MTVQIHWQLDVAANPARSERALRSVDGGLFRDVRTPALNRYHYYAQVGQAAAQTGFDGLFLPHRPQSDDSTIVAAAIAREVQRIDLVTEFPASVGSAVYAAKQAVSFQRQTNGRLAWAITPSSPSEERARDGDQVSDDEAVARLEEFLAVARGVHGKQPFSFSGRHFAVADGGFADPLNRVPFPKVFLSGDTEEALTLSARVADVHLFAASTPARVYGLTERLKVLADGEGRVVQAGLIQPVLARDEAGEARRDAGRAGLGEEVLIGDYGQVADRLAELAAFGVRHFILASPALLEDAYRIGQRVLPRFRALTKRVAVAA